MSQHSKSNIFRLGLKKKEWNSKYYEINNENRLLYLYQQIKIKEFLDSIFFNSDILLYNLKIQRSYNNCRISVTYFSKSSMVHFNAKPKKESLKTELINLLNSLTNTSKKQTNKTIFRANNKYLNIKNSKLNILNILQKFIGENTTVFLKFYNIKQSIFYKKSFKQKLFKIIYQLRRFQKQKLFIETFLILLLNYQKKNTAELLCKWISIHLSKMKIHNQFLSFLNLSLILLINSNFSNIKGIKILIKGRLNNKPRKQTKIIKVGKISLQTFSNTINQSQQIAFTKNGTLGIKVWIREN